MANPNPPKHTQFKKGQSGNPQGARLHDPMTKALRKHTVESFRKVLTMVFDSNIEELKKLATNPKSTSLEVGIARAMLKACASGDYGIVERIAERIVGKIPEQLTVNSTGTLDVQFDPVKVKAILRKLESEY